ncbi:MAG: precorrin-2 C(20)-methyltransferase [Actinomycetota bacterium]|nr:precorrin-2 C(20)-methyltransferase [Actinomycetota bacterium]
MSDTVRAPGKLWAVGLGPGDSELVTFKAARAIGDADVIAFHCARHGRSIALSVAEPFLREGQIHERLVYPVTTETTDHPGGYRGALTEFYTEAGEVLAGHLRAGRDVALLAEGDPLFYSSYMHMHKRLAGLFDTEIIPGVTSVSAAATAVGMPLVEGEETLTVLPGTMPAAELVRRLRDCDAAAIMKLGRNFGKVRDALDAAGVGDRAWYVERASTGAQKVCPVADVDPASVPYFSMVVVPGPLNNRPTGEPAPAGEVVVVGLGPGADRWTTPEVRTELAAATDLVGYKTYLSRICPRPGQRLHPSDNQVESERACMALDLARRGARVAVVSSGDPGVFAMAAAVAEEAAEPQFHGVAVRVVPGVTAANAVAAAAGAPLGHDYMTISLSDRLKSWELIERRLHGALDTDLVLAIYNPGSRSRTWQVRALKDILTRRLPADRPVILGRDVGGPQHDLTVTTVADLDPAAVDMRTLVIVGSSTTRVASRAAGPLVFTSRRGAHPVS